MNASAEEGRSEIGVGRDRAAGCEEWTEECPRERTSELDIDGRSGGSEDGLVNALRDH